MNNVRTECTFMWFIENYSYCWHKNGVALNSPEFSADGFQGTAWYLRLYPRGKTVERKGEISLYLRRSAVDNGPEEFMLKCELSVLAANGSILRFSDWEFSFTRGLGYGSSNLATTEEVLLHQKSDYLPQDTLSVCCEMWKGEGNIEKVKQITARTRIGIEKITFLHIIESFSTLEPNQKETVEINSPSKNGLGLSTSLYVTDDSSCEGKIIVEIIPSDANQILFKSKLSLLGRSGKLIQCGEADNRLDATGIDNQKQSLSLTRTNILKRKSEYLQDDKLSLLCECIFSTGIEFKKIERTLHEVPSVAIKQIKDNDQTKDIYDAEKKLSACASTTDDLKTIYSNQLLTDVELKTKTKSFPAHKIMLCARSSVFRAMLTNDMKEKNTNCVEVDDLENDTLQQLLLFLYSDNIENLQWESAMKLYYTGDKYAIEKLKVMCAFFLVNNLSTPTASELLLLADTHNDSDLKKAVEDFILKHEEQVFSSDEWGNLMETHPLLASKTMRLKYMKKL